MRNVDSRLMMEKIDEVRHCISSHQQTETVHVDASTLALSIDTGRVTVMHGQGYTSQLTRQVSVSEHVTEGPWSEELLDSDERLDALVAHLTQHSRPTHHHTGHHKVQSVRGDIDASVVLDTNLRLLNTQTLDGQTESIVVQVPPLPPLPPLQEMKRCQETDWFNNKAKNDNTTILTEPTDLEINVGASPAQNKAHSKKSLPHKKRISRKLKRNTPNSTPQQDIVVINCSEEVQQEEILPDNFAVAGGVPHHQLAQHAAHIAHQVRPLLICQLCGEFFGEEQLKFYHHLKHHYEPQAAIIIENPVPDLGIDKMTNTCIVDNVATLPDSIVELSLENTVPKTVYQPIDKHILYTTSDKTFYTNKVQYSTASMDKDTTNQVPPETSKELYESLDKMEFFSCIKCNKSFKKQKQCEDHIKEVHNSKQLEDMGEFSEPEDLMEGIHVSVEETAEQYDSSLLPHLTVDNGHVRQDHVRHWYLRGSEQQLVPCDGSEASLCPVCPAPPEPHESHQPHDPHQPHTPQLPRDPPHAHASRSHTDHDDARDQEQIQHAQQTHDAAHQLKEEVLQQIFEVEVVNSDQNFAETIIGENTELPAEPDPPAPQEKPQKGCKSRHFTCPTAGCGREFAHRNSLVYHRLSHGGKRHACKDCGKSFYTTGALKVHRRVHNGDKPYKCEDCGRDFRQWSDLKYHTVSLHSNQKHFKCEFCGKEFARKYSLNVHRRIHTGERNYKCDYCTKTFRASSYRLSHMRTHTGDRPYKCNQCEKCFRVAGDLRRHTLTHDKMKNRLEEQRKLKEVKPPPAKQNIKTEIPPNDGTNTNAPKVKKVAMASTARPPVLKNSEKKAAKVKKIKKEGAPNVTVTNHKEFKVNPHYNNEVEVYDTRQEFKEVYTETSEYNKDDKTYEVSVNNYKGSEKLNDDRNLAMLKPIFRNSICNDERPVFEYRGENTDGKMQIFTHIERKDYGNGPLTNTITLSDIRNIERERDLNGEGIENGFLDKLTAFYNIPAV